MDCRPGCGACCIAPSISTPLPKIPNGKPAGVACLHLMVDARCELWGDVRRPQVCAQFKPEPIVCGNNRQDAMRLIALLEMAEKRGRRQPLVPLHSVALRIRTSMCSFGPKSTTPGPSTLTALKQSLQHGKNRLFACDVTCIQPGFVGTVDILFAVIQEYDVVRMTIHVGTDFRE